MLLQCFSLSRLLKAVVAGQYSRLELSTPLSALVDKLAHPFG